MSSVDAEDTPVSGNTIGPYRLARLLGKGGMGTVYLAEAPDGRPVALKVINRELSRVPDFRERFRREVTAARRVRPFCTAAVLEAALDDDPFYIVTEYIEGPTLERVVERHGPLRGSDLEGLAAGVATALSAIHAAGVVHRDLKPDNILLSPFGPRVIDFGIARSLGTDARMTKTGDTMGTPSYMAPEGLIDQPITTLADVFSWGCVVAFAGTGRPPFAGKNVGETLYKTVHGRPNLDGLGPRMRQLVEWATQKDPAARPTAVQLLQELTGHGDTAEAARTVGATVIDPSRETPRSVPPPARDGRTRRSLRTRKRIWAWTAGAFVLSAAAAIFAAVLWPDTSEPRNIFSDDFSRPGSGWATGAGNGEYERYQGGMFVIAQFGTGFHQVQHAPVTEVPKDVRVEATVSVKSINPRDEAGVFCRGTDQLRYDVALIRDGTVRVRKGDGRQGSELAKTTSPVITAPQQGARVGVVCTDEGGAVRIAAWINGRQVAEAVDWNAPLTGQGVGIVAGREGRSGEPPGTEASFDDFVLQRN